MSKAIRTEADARAWMDEHDCYMPETKEKDGVTYAVLDASCGRCGGSGYGPWFQDGGVCYGCGGANTVGRTQSVSLKKYAQGLKRSHTAREKRRTEERERREAAYERKIEGQRNWCEANGHGRITFEELDAARATEREAKKSVSGYVGEVKVRQEFTATIKAIPSWEGNFGTTYCHIMEDDDGNILVWKTGGCGFTYEGEDGCTVFVGKGAKVRFKATVKEHGERDGEKQTLVTRAKLIEALDEEAPKEAAA